MLCYCAESSLSSLLARANGNNLIDFRLGIERQGAVCDAYSAVCYIGDAALALFGINPVLVEGVYSRPVIIEDNKRKYGM